jgi:tRNA (guanine-N7-)-methyltransferase
MKGKWGEQYFKNNNPIVLELGCGKGEYTVGLAKLFPDVNFIGVDIKGSRMWTGATQALNEGLANVAFLRTNIEIIDRFFAEGEVSEIWLTFSDPQMKNPRKRLTSTFFMNRYRHFLKDGGVVHLKTDSNFLFTYTTYMVERNALPVLFRTEDLYHTEGIDAQTQTILGIQTYYESQWIERGLNIRYMKFRLPQEGELATRLLVVNEISYIVYLGHALSTDSHACGQAPHRLSMRDWPTWRSCAQTSRSLTASSLRAR